MFENTKKSVHLNPSKQKLKMEKKHIVVNKINEKNEVLAEAISIDSIRSFRKWNGRESDKYSEVGDVTVLYMKKETETDKDTKQIHVHEKFEHLCMRMGLSVPKDTEKEYVLY